MSNMYEDFKVFNLFVGCYHDCIYCDVSWKRQMKRQKKRCIDCYKYKPHFHYERLGKILPRGNYFLNGAGDVTFSNKYQRELMIAFVENNPDCTFLMQSKNPVCFFNLPMPIPDNLLLGTTIETDDDEIIERISKAPTTFLRYLAMHDLKYVYGIDNLTLTFEPLLKSNVNVLTEWARQIQPKITWVGNCNHMELDCEPTLKETKLLIKNLKNLNLDVRTKTLR